MAEKAGEKGARPGAERIAKRLARAGVCSRREAEAMIAAGRVAVDGQKLTTPATLVTDDSIITVDGAVVGAPERTRVWRYHKPRGLLTTTRDPEGRPTIFENLPKSLPRVISVGRLDFNSEGLLLLTNDGGLSRRLELPETGWLRRYRVRAFGRLTPADLARMAKGITVEGVRYGAIEAQLDREQGDNIWLTMGLHEGKNREIRKVLEAFGLRVSRLIRVAYGPFQLGRLEPSEVEEVPGKVLTEQLGLEKSSVQGARGHHAPRMSAESPAAPRREDRHDAPRRSVSRSRPSHAGAPADARPERARASETPHSKGRNGAAHRSGRHIDARHAGASAEARPERSRTPVAPHSKGPRDSGAKARSPDAAPKRVAVKGTAPKGATAKDTAPKNRPHNPASGKPGGRKTQRIGAKSKNADRRR